VNIISLKREEGKGIDNQLYISKDEKWLKQKMYILQKLLFRVLPSQSNSEARKILLRE